jgi:hypothetical protein
MTQDLSIRSRSATTTSPTVEDRRGSRRKTRWRNRHAWRTRDGATRLPAVPGGRRLEVRPHGDGGVDIADWAVYGIPAASC